MEQEIIVLAAENELQILCSMIDKSLTKFNNNIDNNTINEQEKNMGYIQVNTINDRISAVEEESNTQTIQIKNMKVISLK